VVQPTRSGFGTSVVRELVPYELGGTVELAHLPKGVCCNLHIPVQWLGRQPRGGPGFLHSALSGISA